MSEEKKEAKTKLLRFQRLDFTCLTIYFGSQSTSEGQKVRNERFKKCWKRGYGCHGFNICLKITTCDRDHLLLLVVLKTIFIFLKAEMYEHT